MNIWLDITIAISQALSVLKSNTNNQTPCFKQGELFTNLSDYLLYGFLLYYKTSLNQTIHNEGLYIINSNLTSKLKKGMVTGAFL